MSLAWMVATCLGTGIAIYLLRRLPRLVFVAALVGAGLLAALLLTASDAPLDFFGRTLALDAAVRTFLLPTIALTAALALFSPLTFERASDAPATVLANAQGAFFFWGLAAFVVAIALDSFPLAVCFWIAGLIVSMLLARSPREGRVGGAASFLLLAVLAGASLLLSHRLFELYPLTPDDLDLIFAAVLFLVLGLGLLMGAVPLHLWLGPLADEMPVLGMAFLVGVVQPLGVWLLIERMGAVTGLAEKSPLLAILLLGGGLTAVAGALFILSERREGRFIAYLASIPLGHALIGLSMTTRLGLTGAWLVMLNRGIGVALVAGGVTFARYHAERRWQLVGASAILCGGFALAGIPPTLGFAANWVIYRELAASNPALIALLVASDAAVVFVTLRAARRVTARTSAEGVQGELKIVPYLCAGVVALLLVATVIAGMYPAWLADSLTAMLAGGE